MMAPATDEALLQTGPGGGGGMFTSSNPEDRRIVPANVDGRATFKVVYVVLESQYEASMSAAATKINENQDGIAVEVVGYLLEELRDEGNFAAFKADVETANIFIGSLIFVQELAEKVRGWIRPRSHPPTEADRLQSPLLILSEPFAWLAACRLAASPPPAPASEEGSSVSWSSGKERSLRTRLVV